MNKEEQPICNTDKVGNKVWHIDGLRHRLDGPAIEWINGYKAWYVNGERHRLDGPAVEDVRGYSQWHISDALTHTAQFKLSVGQSFPWHWGDSSIALVIKQINPILFQLLIGNRKQYLFSLYNSQYNERFNHLLSVSPV